jgi:hypothetical protein
MEWMRSPHPAVLGPTLLVAILALGCSGTGDDDSTGPEVVLPFTAVMISDAHVGFTEDGEDADRLAELVGLINGGEWEDVEQVLLSGDIADAVWAEDPPDDPADNYIADSAEILDGLTVAYHPVAGNHEYNFVSSDRADTPEEIAEVDQLWWDAFQRESWGSFTHRGFRFIGLDNFRGRVLNENEHYFEESQLDWMEQLMAEPMPTVLYTHYPVATDHDVAWTLDRSNIVPREEARFFDIVEAHADQIRAIFVGHGHLWVRDTLFETIPVYETGSLGKSFANPRNVHLLRCDPSTGLVEVSPGREDVIYLEAD